MYKFLPFFLLIFFPAMLFAQDWEFTELAEMPEPVSNNSVVGAEINGKYYVYSFAGIDSTKSYSGIHNKCWRYDVDNDLWESLPDLPDPMGKIALGVSVIGNIAYIMGGYHVFANGSELTSEKVHRLDLTTNTFLADAAPIPKPVDDHVQVVYKDSLIYLVTGWSGTQTAGTNVPNVQIYNPANDSWTVGSPVPNNNRYKVFGSSGVIVGDKIYYFGGAKINGFNFESAKEIRIGTIDPNLPAMITWEHQTTDFSGYRTAATVVNDVAYFLGGSNITYNYDGLAYSNNSGVPPNQSSLLYDPALDTIIQRGLFPEMPMDLRSLAEISNAQKIIAGGMEADQKVSKKTWLLDFIPVDYVKTTEIIASPEIFVFPNPATDVIRIDSQAHTFSTYTIYDLSGRILQYGKILNETISIHELVSGNYLLSVSNDQGDIGYVRFSKM